MEDSAAILYSENKRRNDELKWLLAEMVVILEMREIMGPRLEDRYCREALEERRVLAKSLA
ncbi:TPA: hypothetical protein JAN03_24605 [Citrobacter freundii]|nr:hypothetical protein [Citrobacter freundii]